MIGLKAAVLVVCLGLLASSHLCAAEKWWNDEFEYRVPLTLKETAGIERKNVPALITGEAFIKNTGVSNVNTHSFRLINSKGGEFPVQVDEKDNTGLYQSSPNYKLDPDDEILFQVDLAAKKKGKYYLYFSGKVTPEPEYGSDVVFEKVSITRSKPYNVSLSNAYLLVGIRGSADEEPYKGYSRACIARLTNRGKELVRPGGESLFWGPTQGLVSWSNPELIARGPVRTTVRLSANNVDNKFKRTGGGWTITEPTKGTLKGKMQRCYSLYNGLPYVECREIYQIKKSSPNFSASFVFSFRTAPVSPLERGDILYGPWEGKIYPIKLEDKSFFNTKYPSEGWVGIHSEKEKNGLALFFDYKKTVYVHACVIRSYLRERRLGKKRDESLSSDFGVTYKIEDMRSKKTACNRFGLYVLGEEKGKEIRNLYSALWGSPLEMKWGRTKEKK